MSGAAVFKRLPLAAKGVQVYQVSKATYRAGAALGMDLSVTKKPLNQALDAAIHKPQFLEVDTLKGYKGLMRVKDEVGGGVKETNPLLKDLPKDTAKNWEIDIVECLEKLKVDLFEDDDDDEEGGDHPINFAQAAIGLYHSATVYARKIDSLYLKMYETMELLGRGVGEKERRKNAREAKKLRKKLGIFDDGDGCELLDNKIVRAPDSQLNMLKGGGQKGMNTNHSFVHRVPLFLVPREEGDRKRPEYKVSGCTVNPYNMAVLLPDLEGKCSTNMEEDIILRKHSGNDGTAADVAPLPPPPTQTLVEAPGMPSIDDEGEGEEEANASAAAALNDYPPHDDGDDGVSLPDQHDDDYNNDSGIGAEPAPVTGEENEGEAIHDAVLDASSTNSLPNGDLQPVNESNAIDVYEGEEDDDEDDEEEEGIWTLLDPYVNPGKKPHKPMKIGIVGKPITVKVQNAASIKLSNGRRAAMNLDIAEDSILPNTSDRPALVWQTMGEYPEAASIENKLALQVSNNRKESRKVVRQRNERASMERMKALQQLRATRNVVTEAERREEKPQHGIDEGGESSVPTADDINMSPGSSGDDGVKRKEGRKKKYGIRLLDADKCVNYDVEEGDDIDVGDNNIASRRGKKKPRRITTVLHPTSVVNDTTYYKSEITPANEIDKGSIIKQKWKEDGPSEYWEINNVRQVKQGRQAAHVSLEYTNLTSNKPERWKGSTTAKFNVVKVEKQACQILYWDNDEKVFYVQDDEFNQQELPQRYVKDASKFLKNGDQVTLWLDDDEIVKSFTPTSEIENKAASIVKSILSTSATVTSANFIKSSKAARVIFTRPDIEEFEPRKLCRHVVFNNNNNVFSLPDVPLDERVKAWTVNNDDKCSEARVVVTTTVADTNSGGAAASAGGSMYLEVYKDGYEMVRRQLPKDIQEVRNGGPFGELQMYNDEYVIIPAERRLPKYPKTWWSTEIKDNNNDKAAAVITPMDKFRYKANFGEELTDVKEPCVYIYCINDDKYIDITESIGKEFMKDKTIGPSSIYYIPDFTTANTIVPSLITKGLYMAIGPNPSDDGNVVVKGERMVFVGKREVFNTHITAMELYVVDTNSMTYKEIPIHGDDKWKGLYLHLHEESRSLVRWVPHPSGNHEVILITQKFLDALPGHAGTMDVYDCNDIVTHAVEDLYNLTGKKVNGISVFGGSHGGFLCGHLMGASDPTIRHRYQCGILWNPAVDLLSQCLTTDIPEWCFVEAFPPTTTTKPSSPTFTYQSLTMDEIQRMRDVSATRLTNNVDKPVLVLLGESDQRVPHMGGLRWAQAVSVNGKCPSVDVYMYPGQGHAIDKPEYENEYGNDMNARLRAERELRERDRGEGRRLPGAVFGEDSSDSEGEDDRMGAYERKRRRLERLRRAAQAEDDDAAMDDEFDADLIDLNNEEVGPDTDLSPDSRLGKKIIANFTKFLQTFVDPNEDATEAYYSEKIHQMCAEGKTSFTVSFHPHLADWSPFMAQWLCDRPHHILNLLHQAATEYTKKKYKELFANDRHREINVRIVSFPVIDLIRNLRAFHINKLVNVVGNNNDTGTGPYAVNREETVYKNHQVITLQESPGSVLPGRMPRSVEVILSGDLVDSVRPGDQCSIVGTYHARYDSAGNVRAGFPVFKCAIDANSIIRQNEMKIESVRDEDKREIFALSKDPHIRERIIASIAPSVYGATTVKTALAMALFGGREKVAQGRHRIRGDINVLILGDPGLAKSQCLKFVNKLFQRSVYTTGKGASAVGLTASVRKDYQTGEYTLEGGALVLADSGICLIDEFDKMNDADRTSIHEAMEQQSISISKAGIVASLSAKCSVVAAANPVGGRYNPSLTFTDNVDLTDPILSRFDALCVIRDEIDIFQDERLADFVVCTHMQNHPREPNDNISDVDADKLANFYKEIRSAASDSHGLPMTVRHIESMIRMAEASAKMELRDYVTSKDIDHAIATMLSSFIMTQKHAVAERLRRRFEAKYISSVTDHNELLHFVLRKLFKQQMDLVLLTAGIGRDAGNIDDADIPEVTIDKNAFIADLRNVREYLESALFAEVFTMDEDGKTIRRKAVAAAA
ncbi:MCM DNA helicase complex subunit [Perkinsus chesapeaki]|uniref:DNA helicase n=1 Tax=Perkinsus chesapeaki TaxID=330153 RepID=A0A7J6MRQ6_PERCH|nr:MCM DNA helicase complex subunit [Perkinsus chesapeaki]